MRTFVDSAIGLARITIILATLFAFGCTRTNSTTPRYFVAVSLSAGRLVLQSTNSERGVTINLSEIGSILSATVFDGQLLLGSTSPTPDASDAGPGLGLWAVSISTGQVRRVDETGLSGDVRMCAVFGDQLWLLAGDQLWSSPDLKSFQLITEDVRRAFVTSSRTLITQSSNGTFSWFRISNNESSTGIFNKWNSTERISYFIGDYAYFEDGSVVRFSVPGIDANRNIELFAREPRLSRSARYDARYKQWITIQTDFGTLIQNSRVYLLGSSSPMFIVKESPCSFALEISNSEFLALNAALSSRIER